MFDVKSPGKSSAPGRCQRGFHEQIEILEGEEGSAPEQKFFENCGGVARLFPPGL